MGTKNSTLSGLEPLLSIEELAEDLDVPVTTIRGAPTARGRTRSRSTAMFASPSGVLAWLLRQRETESGRGPSGG